MSIAFFDFDKTLIHENSGTLWVKSEFRHGHLSPPDAVRAAIGLTKYTLGFVQLEAMLRLAIERLAGSEEAALRQRVIEFYREEVQELYRARGRAVVEEHRANGEQVVLLTSASIYLSEQIQEELSLDGLLCNRFEVDSQGIFTGRPQGEICYGEGKLVHAKAYAQAQGAKLEDCAFYTDSMADLSVMEVVGRPVAINPDPRLKRHARRRGWPIEDWND